MALLRSLLEDTDLMTYFAYYPEDAAEWRERLSRVPVWSDEVYRQGVQRFKCRYPVRDFTMGDIGISILPPRRSPSRRIPELAETEQHRLIRWRSTNLREAGHPFTSPNKEGTHGPPYRVQLLYKL